MNIYEVRWDKNKDDWSKLLYIRLDTTDNLELIKKTRYDKHVNEIKDNLELINAKNISFACIGSYKKYATKLDVIFDLFKFNKKEDGQYVFYYNTTPLSYDKIARIIIKASEFSHAGICAFDGYHFDFVIFKDVGKIMINKNTAFIVTSKKRLRLVDIKELISVSKDNTLEDACKTYGIEVGSDEKDYNTYRINYVKSMMLLAERFTEENMGFTQARTSRQYIPLNIKTFIPNKMNDKLDFIGGRVEIFQHYAPFAYVYDANSLYPNVLVHFQYPNVVVNRSTLAVLPKEEIDKMYKSQDLKSILKYYLSNGKSLKEMYELYISMFPILHVKLKGISKEFEEYKDILYRYFPFSYKDEHGRRYFRFQPDKEYQIQGYESLFLLMFDFEVSGNSFFCNMSDFPNKEKIEQLIKERERLKQEHSQGFHQYALKVISNSIFGSLGLRVDSVRHKSVHEISDIRNINIEKARIFAKVSAPLHAIATTSSARFFMYSIMLKILLHNYNIYYTDTDSIFTNIPPENFFQLVQNETIPFKYEAMLRDLYVILPKMYVYNNDSIVIKNKGIGNALQNTFAIQTLRTNLTIITKAIDVNTIPRKIPENEHSWVSVWNDKNLMLKETKLYSVLKDIENKLTTRTHEP